MKTIVFAIWDEKAAAYLSPFFMPNEATALRAFGAAVNDKESSFWQFPMDYTLYRLGAFDDHSGHLDKEPPHEVCRAVDVKIAEDPRPLFKEV